MVLAMADEGDVRLEFDVDLGQFAFEGEVGCGGLVIWSVQKPLLKAEVLCQGGEVAPSLLFPPDGRHPGGEVAGYGDDDDAVTRTGRLNQKTADADFGIVHVAFDGEERFLLRRLGGGFRLGGQESGPGQGREGGTSQKSAAGRPALLWLVRRWFSLLIAIGR